MIDDLKAEREILKQANENLVKRYILVFFNNLDHTCDCLPLVHSLLFHPLFLSAFDSDRERQHQALERQLKVFLYLKSTQFLYVLVLVVSSFQPVFIIVARICPPKSDKQSLNT